MRAQKTKARPPAEFHDNAIDSTQLGLEEAAKALREDIQSQSFSPQAKAVKVTVEKGQVTLTGHAASAQEEAKLLALAKAHSPHVRDNINVKMN